LGHHVSLLGASRGSWCLLGSLGGLLGLLAISLPPLLSPSGLVGTRPFPPFILFFAASTSLNFASLFFSFVCSVLARSWAAFRVLLDAQVGLSLAQVASCHLTFSNVADFQKALEHKRNTYFFVSTWAQRSTQDEPKTAPRRSSKTYVFVLVFVFDFVTFWMPFWIHVGLPNRPKFRTSVHSSPLKIITGDP